MPLDLSVLVNKHRPPPLRPRLSLWRRRRLVPTLLIRRLSPRDGDLPCLASQRKSLHAVHKSQNRGKVLRRSCYLENSGLPARANGSLPPCLPIALRSGGGLALWAQGTTTRTCIFKRWLVARLPGHQERGQGPRPASLQRPFQRFMQPGIRLLPGAHMPLAFMVTSLPCMGAQRFRCLFCAGLVPGLKSA